MTKDDLITKRVGAEARYNQLQSQVDALQSQLKELDTEMVMLRGEYRALTSLVDTWDNPQPDPALVIDATPAEESDGPDPDQPDTTS